MDVEICGEVDQIQDWTKRDCEDSKSSGPGPRMSQSLSSRKVFFHLPNNSSGSKAEIALLEALYRDTASAWFAVALSNRVCVLGFVR
jgi:hypothetical protein